MALDIPETLSPSKVSTFTDCALAFRFVAIDKIPKPPSEATVKGTLVHRALELLFAFEPSQRTFENALDCLVTATADLEPTVEWQALELTDDQQQKMCSDAKVLVEKYFQLENPADIQPVGLELFVEHFIEQENSTMHVRGVIDRLEVSPEGIVITDYKTGRAPSLSAHQNRLTGVNIYAYLCEKTRQERPAKVQLLYLGTPAVVETIPTEQSLRQVERKLTSIWSAIETACEKENFRPKPSRLCNWCPYQQWCPEYGGDPARARDEFLASGRDYPLPPPALRR